MNEATQETSSEAAPLPPCPCGSGKTFAQCHGASQPVSLVSLVEPMKPELHVETPKLKLDLAAGQTPKEGFEGVDIWPQSKHVLDLTRFPWPWADNSVDEIHCVLPDQLVDTPDGLRRIEMIRIGDAVIGRTGSTRVTRVLVRRYKGLVYRISTAESSLIVTKEHPIGTPRGWLQADQLRHGDAVLQSPAKVKGAHLVDCIDVPLRVGDFVATCAMLSTNSAQRLQATSAEGRYQIELRAFPSNIRTKFCEQVENVLLPTHGDYPGALAVRTPDAILVFAPTRRKSHVSDDVLALRDDQFVSIREVDLYGDLRALRNVEVDGTLPVEETGKPSKIGVEHVTSIEAQPYDGLVFNLITEDHTFAAGGILTHNCSHFVEHLPMEFVDEHGNYVPMGTPGAKDLLFKFFDEIYRVLVPHGWVTIVCPNAFCNRAFQDPTHRRFIVGEMFLYLHKPFREANKLDHYNVACNFDGGPDQSGQHIRPIVMNESNAWHVDVQARRFSHEINHILDWQANLRACK